MLENQPDRVRLPKTSGRAGSSYPFVQVLAAVRTFGGGSTFEGRVFRPGADVLSAGLGPNPVALEFVGPVGPWSRGRKQECEWILWRFNWDTREWQEIARVRAIGREWAAILAPAAQRALHPDQSQEQAFLRSHEVAVACLDRIKDAVAVELPVVRMEVLQEVRDVVGAWILDLCA